MKNKLMKISLSLMLVLALVALAGCQTSQETQAPQEKTEEATENQEKPKNQVVNLYTDRHYETDEELYKMFTEETGIKVNVVKGKSDELIERLAREGADTQADLLITADAGRLFRAKEKELLQSVDNETLFDNIPENLRDEDNQWFGLTVRGRVIVYSKDRVNPSELSTYEDLTSDKWEKKILVRSSSNIYNQSLLASFIAINGEEKAKEWAKGIVKNMARDPEGNDRAQAKAIVAGEGDLAIMNTYYIGKMLNSSDPEEVKVAKSVGVFFPNQDTTGTHINVSGIGLARHAKNSENAIKLMEFLSSEKAQKQFAEANYEYPVNPDVEPSELLKSWGEFKTQDINLSKLGEFNKRAVEIFNEIGWK
ncbi:Fe(3+) ABC transporter substrate-binding protein [Paramaledivibacter caminithermalis]|uniref:Iron(III) transport system substrate-binding protein n=1 Tax=Paramaledivibacter caminithermalis (strain DSM 15212 / CIP 107654 / DViRD3) TaxID=1121301 RepID=A0A1M6K3B8_PARC5|nr:Fe(3+) ABC transporter substrate-binding protein [Paramaledivibacter caminithermalis]SHJ53404.1 iron(III) transport system substrate-binding protein [Paramaledivibacter caminithermalis DSM 15212]